MPNSERSTVEAIGMAMINSDVYLKDALLVSRFNYNLISIGKLNRAFNCKIIFWTNECILKDLTLKEIIGVGKFHKGLYYLNMESKPMVNLARLSADAEVLHRRLRHIPF